MEKRDTIVGPGVISRVDAVPIERAVTVSSVADSRPTSRTGSRPSSTRTSIERTSIIQINTSAIAPVTTPPRLSGDGDTDTLAFAPTRSKTRIALIMTALCISLFMAALNQTVVATAVPAIAADLGARTGYSWISGSYLIASACSAPVWAKLSDIFGRKVVMLASVAWFFVGSLLCAVSINLNMLIASRAMQGAAAGGIFQLVMIIISDLFSLRQRGVFFGLMEIGWTLASGLGPILGGVLSDKLSWRWIWWIALPLAGLSFAVLFFGLDVYNPRTRLLDGLAALDWAGTLSVLGLAVMLLLGLEFGGETFAWSSPTVICLLIFGSLMSLFFIWSEKKLAKFPIMPLEIFSKRSNLGAMLVNVTQAFAFLSADFYLPVLFTLRGATPLRAGTLIVPLVVTASLTAMAVGFIMARTGRLIELIRLGTVLLAIGTGLYIQVSARDALAWTVVSQIVGGAGAGLLFQPPILALQAAVAQKDAATALGAYGFVREISGAVGVVVSGVVFQNTFAGRRHALAAAGLAPELVAELVGGDAAANALAIRNITVPAHQAAVQAAVGVSSRNVWIMNTVVAVLGVGAALLIRSHELSREHVETVTGLKQPAQPERQHEQEHELQPRAD